eukprot:scaffold7657_cov109-Isochrysis_galbana.AAC.7
MAVAIVTDRESSPSRRRMCRYDRWRETGSRTCSTKRARACYARKAEQVDTGSRGNGRPTASRLVIIERSLAAAIGTTMPPVASTWQRLLQLSVGYVATYTSRLEGPTVSEM